MRRTAPVRFVQAGTRTASIVGMSGGGEGAVAGAGSAIAIVRQFAVDVLPDMVGKVGKGADGLLCRFGGTR